MSKYIAIAAALWFASANLASAGPRSLERAMETSTDAVILPTSVPAYIDARGCMQCRAVSMEVPAGVRFFVGRDEVTLAELRKYVLGKSRDMVIFYELDSNVVKRIVVSGVLPKPVAR